VKCGNVKNRIKRLWHYNDTIVHTFSHRFDTKRVPLTVSRRPVAAILWVSWGPDPLTLWQWGIQMCTDPPLLVPRCYTWPVIHSITWLNSACTLTYVVH